MAEFNPTRTTLAEWFTGFRQQSMPQAAGQVQVEECKIAFYSGAMTMLAMVHQLSELDESAASMGMHRLHAELEAFNLVMQAAAAKHVDTPRAPGEVGLG